MQQPITYNTPNDKLRLACYGKDLAALHAALDQGADPNQRASDGESPLSVACAQGSPDLARALIQAGADVNSVSPAGNTALFNCFEEGEQSLECAKILMSAGADLDILNNRGDSVLFYAIAEDSDFALELLAAGARRAFSAQELHQRGFSDKSRDIPLPPRALNAMSAAASHSKPRVIKALLSMGESPLAGALPPLHLVAGESTRWASATDRIECAQLLISHGAPLETRSSHPKLNLLGYTPLMLAIARRHFPLADFLLNHGADAQAVSDNGDSVAAIARKTQNAEIIANVTARARAQIEQMALSSAMAPSPNAEKPNTESTLSSQPSRRGL